MKSLRAIFIVTALLMCACFSEQNTAVADIDPAGWRDGDLRSVSLHNSDTVSLSDISLFVVHRRTLAEEIDSLMLSITTITPDSIEFSEHIVIYPDPGAAEASAAWHETRYPYRSDARLIKEGQYTFVFSHANAIPVTGIKAIGVEIEAAK